MATNTPTKEETTPAVKVNGNTDSDWSKPLRQLFTELISCNSVMNEAAAELYFYSFMGAYLNKVKIKDGVSNKDLRVSLCWIQTARSGKGRVNKAMKKICDACGVSCQIITQYTEAGLIGTIDEEAIKANDKYISEGLCEASPSIIVKDKNGNDKTILWRDPIIRGDAGNYDILIFDEMQILLEPKRENQEIILSLQPVLDCPPYVRKKLRSKYPIEYSNPLTIIGTTYPFQTVPTIVATSGFLQRMFLLIRKLTIDEIKTMKDMQKTLMDPNISVTFDKKLEIFKKRIEKVGRAPRTLIVDMEARDELTTVSHYFINLIRDRKGGSRETLLSFANTVEEVCLKIAGQYVVQHGGTTIKKNDIRRNFEITRGFMEMLAKKIDVRDDKEAEEEKKRVIEIFKRTISVLKVDHLSKKEFKEAINKVFNKGLMGCAAMIDAYTEAGYFTTRKGTKNTINYYLNNE